MTVLMKRPRMDELLYRDHSLSTIHPAKKACTGADATKLPKVRKAMFYTENAADKTSECSSANENTNKAKDNKTPSLQQETTPLGDVTNQNSEDKQVRKLYGFSKDGLLAQFGASNAVTQKLLSSRRTDASEEVNADEAASDLNNARRRVLETIRKVSFLTKEQKLRLMNRIHEHKDKEAYGVELKQCVTICEFLNREQEKCLLRLRQLQNS